MALRERLLEAKAALTRRWFNKILGTYPRDRRVHLAEHSDRFTNPVGHSLATATEALVAAVLERSAPEVMCAHLEEIIKIRSLQEYAPSEAVAFTLLLKDAIREELDASVDDPEVRADLREVDMLIDQLMLFAFDIYTKCREQMYELRVNEIKRQVAGVLRREGLCIDDPGPVPDVAVAGVRRLHPRKEPGQ
jgi:hypothetical protein